MSLLRASNLALDTIGAIEREVDEHGTSAISDELRAVMAEDFVQTARVALRLARRFHADTPKITITTHA